MKIRLSKVQYIAVRSILNAKISLNPDSTATLKTLHVDHPGNDSDVIRNRFISESNVLVLSVVFGTTSLTEVSRAWMKTSETFLPDINFLMNKRHKCMAYKSIRGK